MLFRGKRGIQLYSHMVRILQMKHAHEWVRTSDPVIRTQVRYIWTTAPASL